MKKIMILISIIILCSLAFSGCIDVSDISDDLTKKMTIVTFTVTPTIIELGGNANLSWVVTGSDTVVSIDNGIGSVGLTGYRIISPTETTIYKLTASNGTSTKYVTTEILVTEDDQNENPQPAPSFSWILNSADNSMVITKSATGYAYASTVNNPNLVFISQSDSIYRLYVSSTYDLVTTQQNLCVEDIIAEDTIRGFNAGTYQIIWEPTDEILGTVTFTSIIEEPKTTPKFSWIPNSADNSMTITKGASGYAYATTVNSGNLQFVDENGGLWYVGQTDKTLVLTQTMIALSTKTIEAGDKITGFQDGLSYTIVWILTDEVIGTIST